MKRKPLKGWFFEYEPTKSAQRDWEAMPQRYFKEDIRCWVVFENPNKKPRKKKARVKR